MSNTARQPPLPLALLVTLAASAAQSWLAVLLATLTRHVDAQVYYVASSLVGGWALRLILDAIGYEISYPNAVIALLAGDALAVALVQAIPSVVGPPVRVVPAVSLGATIPSLFLSAWLVQTSGRRLQELPH